MLCALSVATSRSYLLKRSAQLFTEATNASWTVVSYNCVTIIPCDILLLLSKRRLRHSYRRSYRRGRESSFEVWPGIDANCCYLGECQLRFNNRVVEMSSYGLVVGRLSAVVVSLSKCFSVARYNNHTVTSVAKTIAADGYHLEDLRWAELPMNGPKSPQRLSFVHLLRFTPLLASLLLWLVRWAWHKAQVETCS